MRIDIEFLTKLAESKIIKIVKIPKNHNTYEYLTHVYNEGTVSNVLELDNPIEDEFGNAIGYFNVSFEHNILVYNLKE